MRARKPFEHFDRAEEIIDNVEAKYTADLLDAANTLALAQAHIALANAKMIGGQRA